MSVCCPQNERVKLFDPRPTNIERLRAALQQVKAGAYNGIEFNCFNKSEADEMIGALSPEDKRLVRFKWLVSSERQRCSCKYRGGCPLCD